MSTRNSIFKSICFSLLILTPLTVLATESTAIREDVTRSLSGSRVAFYPSVGGDEGFIYGNSQTFCFKADTYTSDWEWVNNLWMRFPTDWSVSGVYRAQ